MLAELGPVDPTGAAHLPDTTVTIVLHRRMETRLFVRRLDTFS
jgi:hypothetical protein